MLCRILKQGFFSPFFHIDFTVPKIKSYLPLTKNTASICLKSVCKWVGQVSNAQSYEYFQPFGRGQQSQMKWMHPSSLSFSPLLFIFLALSKQLAIDSGQSRIHYWATRLQDSSCLHLSQLSPNISGKVLQPLDTWC